MAKQTPIFSVVRIWSFHKIFHGNKAKEKSMSADHTVLRSAQDNHLTSADAALTSLEAAEMNGRSLINACARDDVQNGLC